MSGGTVGRLDAAGRNALLPAEPWSDGDASEDPGKVANYEFGFEELLLSPSTTQVKPSASCTVSKSD